MTGHSITRKDKPVINKTLASVIVAASTVGVTGVAASPALADDGSDFAAKVAHNAVGAQQALGNTTTGGYMSPNISLINGSLNRVCLLNDDQLQELVNVLQLVDLGIQDLFTSKVKNVCSDGSAAVDKGDDPSINIPILSENGVANDN